MFLIAALTFCFIANMSIYTGINSDYAYYVMSFLVVLAAVKYAIRKFRITDQVKADVILFQFKYNFLSKVVIYA